MSPAPYHARDRFASVRTTEAEPSAANGRRPVCPQTVEYAYVRFANLATMSIAVHGGSKESTPQRWVGPDRFGLAGFAGLADALEEAGCADQDVLQHLRQLDQRPARGCWVLRVLLREG
jgi:hypothetical protein